MADDRAVHRHGSPHDAAGRLPHDCAARTQRRNRNPRRQSFVTRHRNHRLPYERRLAEHAQVMAAHSFPRTTKLYDRRSDETALGEYEKVTI